jgi:hypothetical protein
MSQSTVTSNVNEDHKPSWLSVWKRALFHPTSETYRTLVNESGATTRRALVWLFVSWTLSLALQTPVEGAVTIITNPGYWSTEEIREFLGTPQTWLVGGALGAIIAVAIFAVLVAITQLVAGVLGGQGNFRTLIYVSAAIWAPLLFLDPLTSVPIMSLFLPLATLYGVVLNFIALKAVNELSWGRTIIAGLPAAAVNMGVALLGALLGSEYLFSQLYTLMNVFPE